jgi:phosphoglycerate kinase
MIVVSPPRPDPVPAAPLREPLEGKTVILRADLTRGPAPDLVRTARECAALGARVAIIAGYGDPQGDYNPAFSLRRFVEPLRRLSGLPVTFIPECVGAAAEAGLAKVPFGTLALMENLRFHADERRSMRSFAIRLSVLGDFFTVPGGMPETAARWIRDLADLLPSPDIEPIAIV